MFHSLCTFTRITANTVSLCKYPRLYVTDTGSEWPLVSSQVIGDSTGKIRREGKKRHNDQVPAIRPAFSLTTAEALVVRNLLVCSKRNKFVPANNDPHI